MKEFIDLNLFDDNSNLSKYSYYHRAVVRRIRRKYQKLKVLTKRRCIQLKVDIKSIKIKTLLNCENKVTFINKIIIKRLKLFFFIHKKICSVANIKLKIFEVYFFIVVVIDKNECFRYFEKLFLKTSINENLILNML